MMEEPGRSDVDVSKRIEMVVINSYFQKKGGTINYWNFSLYFLCSAIIKDVQFEFR